MIPAQQNLILNQIKKSEVNLSNGNKESIVKAITQMNIDGLHQVLDNNLKYQNATKDVFLNKIDDLFKHLKKNDDTLLLAEGKCNSKECPNYQNCGALFYGDKTMVNFNLIFEVDDNENIIDIRYCNEFKPHKTFRKFKDAKELKIDFYDDEVADFNPTLEYIYVNTTSLEALTEFKNILGRFCLFHNI